MKNIFKIIFFIFTAILTFKVQAQEHDGHENMVEEGSKVSSHAMAMKPGDCKEMTAWDYSTASCQPVPMKGMPMKMWMIHGNAFFVQSFEDKPRGQWEKTECIQFGSARV